MTAINSMLMVLAAIGFGLAIGQLLFSRAGGSSLLIYSGIGTATGTFWTLTGVFMIIGGFVKGGVLVIAFAYYITRGHYKRFNDARSSSRSWLAGSK